MSLEPLKAPIPSSGCERPPEQPILTPEKSLEWKIFLTHFMRESEEGARKTLIDFLSGKEIEKINPVKFKFPEVATKVERILKTLVRQKILDIPSPDKSQIEKKVWLYRCLSTMQKVREQIPSGKILGTEDKLYNALYGMTRFKLFDPGIAQEASLRKNTGLAERLQGGKARQDYTTPKYQPRKREVQSLSLPELFDEQMKVAGLELQISCAHLQGDRSTQEDGHVIKKINFSEEEIGFLTILDGHGGSGLTKFLQENLPAALRVHLEIVGKPLKSLEDGEIENVFTTFPPRLQQFWNQNKEEWRKKYLLDELEGFITKLVDELIKKWTPSFQSCDPSTVEMFVQTLSTMKEAVSAGKSAITEVNDTTASAFFEFVVQFVNAEKQKVQSLNLATEEKELLEDIYQEIEENLEWRKDHWEYDPGAVLTMDFILDRGRGPELWTSNVGDAGSIVIQEGKILPVTEEASLHLERFRKGVVSRGGEVIQDGQGVLRVGGPAGVNVARSLGDTKLKGVSPRGKVQKMEIKLPCTAILSCDGLNDWSSHAEVGQKFIQCEKIPEVHPAATVVLDSYSKGSTDNISCIVAQILPT